MVNIKNFENLERINIKDFLPTLFTKQKELVLKYKDIETICGKKMSEYLDGTKLKTINDLQSQELCKNFAWRITEEIGEGLDSLESSDRVHLKEELSDGLHFITELLILNGFEASDFDIKIIRDSMKKIQLNYPRYLVNFIHFLGMSMNCCKIKPWKISEILVDENKFRERLKNSFYLYFELVASFGFSLEELSEGYIAKNLVNQFRIETKY